MTIKLNRAAKIGASTALGYMALNWVPTLVQGSASLGGLGVASIGYLIGYGIPVAFMMEGYEWGKTIYDYLKTSSNPDIQQGLADIKLGWKLYWKANKSKINFFSKESATHDNTKPQDEVNGDKGEDSLGRYYLENGWYQIIKHVCKDEPSLKVEDNLLLAKQLVITKTEDKKEGENYSMRTEFNQDVLFSNASKKLKFTLREDKPRKSGNDTSLVGTLYNNLPRLTF